MKLTRKRRKVSNTFYKWDKWLDGATHTLVVNKHFQVSNRCFRAALQYQCGKRGITYSLIQSEDQKTVRLTATRAKK